MAKFYEYIGRVERLITKVFLVVFSILVFAAAVARFIRMPIVWANDMATFLFAWCVFLGGDLAMRQDKLVKIEIVINMLPQKVRKYLELFNWCVIILFLISLIVYGTQLSYTTRFRVFQGIPGFSYTWVTISVPIGSALMLMTAISKVRALFGKGSSKETEKSNESCSCELI